MGTLMDGLSKGAGVNLGGGLWQVVDTPDFDGDGKSDLLWRNTNSGQFMGTLMDGLSKGAGVNLGGGLWQVVNDSMLSD
jgi:hypothetical protein